MSWFSRRTGAPAAVRNAVLKDLEQIEGAQIARRAIEETIEKVPDGYHIYVTTGGHVTPLVDGQEGSFKIDLRIFKPLLLLLVSFFLLALDACAISPGRALEAKQDPNTGRWIVSAENHWIGGPVTGDVEIHGADGSLFVAHFGADSQLDAAERARIHQEVQLTARIDRVVGLIEAGLAAYMQSQGVPIPAPKVAAPGGP